MNKLWLALTVTISACSKDNFFFDAHYWGGGNVISIRVADANAHEWATQNKYGVDFISFQVDEKDGIVMCIAVPADSSTKVRTCLASHGLISDDVHSVRQGN